MTEFEKSQPWGLSIEVLFERGSVDLSHIDVGAAVAPSIQGNGLNGLGGGWI